jgi:hypothetical protein
VRLFLNFFWFGPPIGDVKLVTPALLTCRLFLFQCANTIGPGGIGAPIVVAQGASVRQYIGAPMSLSANRQCLPSMVSPIMFRGFFFHVRSAITIGAGGIGAPIELADYKEDDCVPRASPIFIPIAY